MPSSKCSSVCAHGRFTERHCEECQEESEKYSKMLKDLRLARDFIEDDTCRHDSEKVVVLNALHRWVKKR